MKEHIDVWTYWLGLASAVIALAMRTFNALGFWLPGRIAEGITIWYMSFYKAAVLFFVIDIATALGGLLHILRNQSSSPFHAGPEPVVGQPAGKSRAATAGI